MLGTLLSLEGSVDPKYVVQPRSFSISHMKLRCKYSVLAAAQETLLALVRVVVRTEEDWSVSVRVAQAVAQASSTLPHDLVRGLLEV